MTHKPTILKLAGLFAVGKVYAEPRRPGWKTTWQWVCFSDDAAYVLYLMYPWLVTKRREARVALRFGRVRGSGKAGRKVPQEAAAGRERAYRVLRALKGYHFPIGSDRLRGQFENHPNRRTRRSTPSTQ